MQYLMKSITGFSYSNNLDPVLYFVSNYWYELIGFAETQSDLFTLWNQDEQ